MLLAELLRPTLEADPDRPALPCGGQTLTHRQLDDVAIHLARKWLAEGMENGDRVALLLPNRPEALLTYLACFKAGLITVPLDYRYRTPQINYTLRHSGSRILLAHADRQEELAECEAVKGVTVVVVGGPCTRAGWRTFDEWCETASGTAPLPKEFRPDDPAVIFYTSGTTSRPKGVTLRRAALIAGTTKYLARVPLRPDDVALVAAPITRPFALRSQVLPTLRAGGEVNLLERFTPAAYVAALRQPPAKTFLALIPSALHQVVHHPDIRRDDFAKLRLCLSGGDRVPLELHQAFHALTGLELTEQCGMTETGGYALNPPFGRKKAGSIGLPMYGVQVCVVDPHGRDVPAGQAGEIIVSGPLAMDGYWNDTAQTRKALRDGWVYTGDLGRFDDDGYLWFMGRKKDIIVHDGANVSPSEVEDAILQHSAVAEACVVGITDAVHGQNVHAFVKLRPEAKPPADGELLHFAESHMSRQMVPESITVISEMPRTGAGKIDRDRLQWQAEAGTGEL
jgi:acyl-CoA synthetase (AMP-forming)/AMP-acid ligase II